MSRSRKRVPFTGATTASSNAAYKQAEHQRERTAVKIAVRQGREPDDRREFGNPWHSDKDGKLYQPENARARRK